MKKPPAPEARGKAAKGIEHLYYNTRELKLQVKRKGSRHVDIAQRVNSSGEDAPWYRLLAVAIVCRAVMDIEELDHYGADTHKSGVGVVHRAEVNAFAKSGWCALLMSGVSDWNEDSLARLAKS